MRCFANNPTQELYAKYHDEEWGVPVYDDKILFEMLILENAQAGLSWETVLKRREGYREAFHQFNVHKVATMSDEELEALRQDVRIIRNRLKIYSTRKNAIVFIEIQKEFGSFSDYLWGFVNHKPIRGIYHSLKEMPPTTKISDKISKDLKKRGMSFVGSTIIYAYLQGIGIYNDHIQGCICSKNLP